MKRSPMRRKRGKTKYARRERDIPRMLWCKTLPCLLAGPQAPFLELWCGGPTDTCRGPIEAHHAGVHGTGQKAPDNTVIPLCKYHHECVTGKPGGRGVFDEWPRGSVKLWELAAVDHCQALYVARGGMTIYHNPEW